MPRQFKQYGRIYRNVSVRWFDPATGLVHYLYEYAKGVRQQVAPTPPAKGGIWDTLVATRRPVVVNTVAQTVPR